MSFALTSAELSAFLLSLKVAAACVLITLGPVLVEISAGSFEKLGLAQGKTVYCLIKANAVRVEAING